MPPHIPRPDYADHPEGVPVSEQAVRGSAQIKSLTEDEEEGMRVACKVRCSLDKICEHMEQAWIVTVCITCMCDLQ